MLLNKMKKLLGILILGLFLITPSQADDIRDFEIEGMSIGDSLLDYFSEEEINSSYQIKYQDNKFYKVELYSDKFENYELVGSLIRTNDKNYEIQSINGNIFFKNKIKKCLNKKKDIEKEISKLFKEAETSSGKFFPKFDKKTSFYQTNYWLKSGNSASVTCYDWSSSIEKEKAWVDNLSVELYTKETADFILNVTQQKTF